MMHCYYPTTTIAVDDDVDFLRVITQHLGITDCISYSSPSKAVEFLKDKKPFKRISSLISKTPNTSDGIADDYALHINMHNLHHEIYSKERFNDVAVLIIDYYMGEMSGIEACEILRDHPAKKILLTGGADREKIAIDAFNKGIIHRFINKADPDFPSQLKHAVASLREAYFRDLTSSLLPIANTTLLHNPAYINFTRNLQDQFNATEYYLLDMVGSKVFLNSDGMPLWLVVKHDSEIENYITIANDQDCTNDSVEALRKHEMIPFFFSEEDFQQPVSNWDSYLYPAYPFPGIKGYHYAIIEGHVRNNLYTQEIVSYSAHK